MFDAVRNNKRIVQIFLGLITLPFAFWGVDSYVRNSGAGSDLASVGDTKITVQQFEQALRERQDQLRQSLGESFKPEMMNLPDVRVGILNSLVDQRLLLLETAKNRLFTSDEALRNVISNIPSLQEDGKFSMTRYESALRAQGMSQPQFEARLRQRVVSDEDISKLQKQAQASVDAAAALQSAGYFVQAIRPPTVPAGSARLRLSVRASHTPEEVHGLLSAVRATRETWAASSS